MNQLRIRWLGRVSYRDAHACQQAMFQRDSDYLLLLEHPHVFTMGLRGDETNILVDPGEVGAEVVYTDRGGDVTYHGPGQLVGYPVMTVPGKRGGGMADTVAYVRSVEQLVIDSLGDLGLPDCGRLSDYPGVWVDPDSDSPRKIAAIGVRLNRTRSMHGFALNVDCDLQWFDRIVPCGIPDKAVTSLAAEGRRATMREVVDAVVARAADRWGGGLLDRADVAWERELELGVSVDLAARKPEWMRVALRTGPEFRRLRSVLHGRDLVTVCEEAGCPNIYECWSEGAATIMILGDVCTRACGFCNVTTGRPQGLDLDEPARVAKAIAAMGLSHAVITSVNRDDLPDGGSGIFAQTVREVRRRLPECDVEVLIPDFKGVRADLERVMAEGPAVLNHNTETVLRLQRDVRTSARYGRSLALLARAKWYRPEGVVKSGLIVGMGETRAEVLGALADLRAVGVDVITVGQYLRPTARHRPVHRYVHPDEFAEYAEYGRAIGLAHIESGPLVRSSYHARDSLDAAVASESPAQDPNRSLIGVGG